MFAMPTGKRTRWMLLMGAVAGAALSLALIFGVLPLHSDPATRNADATLGEQGKKAGLPVRLKIQKINLDAPIEHVGVAPDGTMDVPKGPTHTAWYDRGPRPGEAGSSVIDGHFDREGGKPGVFYDLNKLESGDKVTVEDDAGTKITFVVRESRRYDPKADATGVFKSQDGKAHLNLITCAGVWNTAEQTYSNRLVVFTDFEPNMFGLSQ